MTVFAIFISLVFAIVFPILLPNDSLITHKEGTTNGYGSGAAYNPASIQQMFRISGFYLFLFIGLVVISTILIATAKRRTTKFISFGIGAIAFSYFLSVFVNIKHLITEYESSTTTYSLSLSSIFMLILFITVLICDIIILVGTLTPKPIKENKEPETI